MPSGTSSAQFLADLEWALRSPSLLSDSTLELPPVDLSKCADGLAAFMKNQSSHRVGKYFERLVEFYLREIRGVEMLAAGRQIKRDGQTVGELDFVFRDAEGTLQHLETAVKFYLYTDESAAGASRLIGPNSADNFERKLKRLTDHQLPLGSVEYPSVEVQHAFVRGCIFYPPGVSPEDATLPRELNSQHLTGTWIHASQWKTLSKEIDTESLAIRIYQKPHWLAPPLADSATLQRPVENFVVDHFRNSTRPLMLSAGDVERGLWREQKRIIVVADEWPSAEK